MIIPVRISARPTPATLAAISNNQTNEGEPYDDHPPA